MNFESIRLVLLVGGVSLLASGTLADDSGFQKLAGIRAKFEAASSIPSMSDLRLGREWQCSTVSPYFSGSGVSVGAVQRGYRFVELRLPSPLPRDLDEYTVVATTGDGVAGGIFRLSLNSDTLMSAMQDDEGNFCPMFIRVPSRTNLVIEFGCEGFDPDNRNTSRPEMIAKERFSAITYWDCTPTR